MQTLDLIYKRAKGNPGYIVNYFSYKMGFPGGSGNEESACSAGDPGSVPVSERYSGGGNGKPL